MDASTLFSFDQSGRPAFLISLSLSPTRAKVTGDFNYTLDLLPDLVENMKGWVAEHLGHYGGRTCFYQTYEKDIQGIKADVQKNSAHSKPVGS